MLLTRRYLNEYQKNTRVYIPEDLKRKLLDKLGQLSTDDEGHIYDYTEQDLYEQVMQTVAEATDDKKPSYFNPNGNR